MLIRLDPNLTKYTYDGISPSYVPGSQHGIWFVVIHAKTRILVVGCRGVKNHVNGLVAILRYTQSTKAHITLIPRFVMDLWQAA